jgi:hypothetical protein
MLVPPVSPIRNVPDSLSKLKEQYQKPQQKEKGFTPSFASILQQKMK